MKRWWSQDIQRQGFISALWPGNTSWCSRQTSTRKSRAYCWGSVCLWCVPTTCSTERKGSCSCIADKKGKNYTGIWRRELTSRLCCQVFRVEGRLVSGPNVRYKAKASAGPIAIASSSWKPSALRATTAPLLSNLTSAICSIYAIDHTCRHKVLLPLTHCRGRSFIIHAGEDFASAFAPSCLNVISNYIWAKKCIPWNLCKSVGSIVKVNKPKSAISGYLHRCVAFSGASQAVKCSDRLCFILCICPHNRWIHRSDGYRLQPLLSNHFFH